MMPAASITGKVQIHPIGYILYRLRLRMNHFLDLLTVTSEQRARIIFIAAASHVSLLLMDRVYTTTSLSKRDYRRFV
jgi:hypothetical protein